MNTMRGLDTALTHGSQVAGKLVKVKAHKRKAPKIKKHKNKLRHKAVGGAIMRGLNKA